MSVFSLAKTFFTPLATGRTLINIGMRGISSLSADFIHNFTQKLKQEPLTFKEKKPNASGIRYVASYGDIPIFIRINVDFPDLPFFTVFARFTEQNKKTRKPLFMFEDLNQLPVNWQIPDRQPKPDTNFHPK